MNATTAHHIDADNTRVSQKTHRFERRMEDAKKDIRSAASEEEKQTTTTGHHQQQQHQQSVRKRVGGSNHSTKKSQTANLQHPWLVSTLKGHERPVLDLSYSSNGKYLVSSSQGDGVVSDITKEKTGSSSSSSGNSSSSNSSSPVSSTTSSPYLGRSKKSVVSTTGLSRRQKKNLKSRKTTSNGSMSYESNSVTAMDRQSEEDLDRRMQLTMYIDECVMSAEDRKKMGYPIMENGDVMIYKEEMPFRKQAAAADATASAMDAVHFATSAMTTISHIPSPSPAELTAANIAAEEADKASVAAAIAVTALTTTEALEAASDAASSAAVAKSRSNALSGSLEVLTREFVPDSYSSGGESSGDNDSDDSGYVRTIVQKRCVRCSTKFRFEADTFKYLNKEKCVYHWGKLLKPWADALTAKYTCCNGEKGSEGCSTGRLHVWDGVDEGTNGPLYNFMTLRPAKNDMQRNNPGIFAIDCEMVYTAAGLELARVTVVDHEGKLVIDEYVRPKYEIICYNTRFSGITAEHMKPFGPSTTMKRLKYMLEKHMCQESILVGHGLDGDLRSLRLIHGRCVDTVQLFPHPQGLPMRRALRHLVANKLRRNIQLSAEGHNSLEDARATMDLLIWYVKNRASQVD